MDEMRQLGNKVILITSENLKEKDWPHHAISEIYYMHESAPSVWNLDHLVEGFSYLLKQQRVDAVVALDDYDVEKAAMLRETFRIAGMGQTTYRYFRDKLAMRQMAKKSGISVPEFCAVFNDEEIKEFIARVDAPWVLKPRSEASASGIKKIKSEEELWPALEALGQERYRFLLESFKPGDVFHVDSLVYEKKIVFSCVSKYLAPPMAVSHDGGAFRTMTLGPDDKECRKLSEINADVLKNFGLVNGATHSEFIKGADGRYYFLETSSRVGGAHIPDMVEAATGINIWREWARLENALLRNETYSVATPKKDFAGLIISLVKERTPDTEPFQRKEVVKFLPLEHHIGIVYKADSEETIQHCLTESESYIRENMLNILPPK